MLGMGRNTRDLNIPTRSGITVSKERFEETVTALQTALVNPGNIAEVLKQVEGLLKAAAYLVDLSGSMQGIKDVQDLADLPQMLKGTDFDGGIVRMDGFHYPQLVSSHRPQGMLDMLRTTAIRALMPWTVVEEEENIPTPVLGFQGETPLLDAIFAELHVLWAIAKAAKAQKLDVAPLTLVVLTDGMHSGGVVFDENLTGLCKDIRKKFKLTVVVLGVQPKDNGMFSAEVIEGAQRHIASILGGVYVNVDGDIRKAMGIATESTLMPAETERRLGLAQPAASLLPQETATTDGEDETPRN